MTEGNHGNAHRRQSVIMHVDMDAFFVSVEILHDPSLAGRPVIVGHDSMRSVVLSASYDCRAVGVRSAMPVSRAKQLAPHALIVEPKHWLYAEASEQVMALLREITPLVEQVSVDEAFLDVTGSMRRLGRPREIGQRIRDDIQHRLNLPSSVGIGPNKFVAKMASTHAKPNGLLEVPPRDVVAFLQKKPVRALWGVGPKTAVTLERVGIKTVEDLAHTPRATLTKLLGSSGAHLHDLSWGIDHRTIQTGREEKSIGAEETFAKDVWDFDLLEAEVLKLSYKVARRLRNASLVARGVTLKLKYADFVTVSRSVTLGSASNSATVFAQAINQLLINERPKMRAVRLIGVRCDHLSDDSGERQFTFERSDSNWAAIDAVADAIAQKFSDAVPLPATLLKSPAKAQSPRLPQDPLT
ncbi:DNA polymerase IV [Neomicrococcus lactis]|uniref:DNA polymerase IV n=1 Tax=Neomicrococcus lactis TaxID=732241 RepID=UPI0023016196|nr:DNA polymerase IV [Neomicrococcus lactis]